MQAREDLLMSQRGMVFAVADVWYSMSLWCRDRNRASSWMTRMPSGPLVARSAISFQAACGGGWMRGGWRKRGPIPKARAPAGLLSVPVVRWPAAESVWVCLAQTNRSANRAPGPPFQASTVTRLPPRGKRSDICVTLRAYCSVHPEAGDGAVWRRRCRSASSDMRTGERLLAAPPPAASRQQQRPPADDSRRRDARVHAGARPDRRQDEGMAWATAGAAEGAFAGAADAQLSLSLPPSYNT
ncbi:uncharacterized protein BDZ99DRAFT_477273 [Mytilinidion resinicola]|uniref:Uncharacterized protein n=1 Tax=Mytilinidion resinicola TaxID=574789 RepID=A0A6A6YIX1_9PEZI|nr:uncharacterized protein BDZ99DRAFT_477273 [Mytilinidion resinicola]KAF2808740.1 hypothetical protein BDZ99DRAFT_477273 [Mytilinidion resinicola]